MATTCCAALATCFRTTRLDVVLVDHDKMIVMELTVCFETNSYSL